MDIISYEKANEAIEKVNQLQDQFNELISIQESGLTNNGYYVKWTDGTMECWHNVNLGNITDYGAGTFANPYATGSYYWVYPFSFADVPVVTGMTGTTENDDIVNTSSIITFKEIDSRIQIRLQGVRLTSSNVSLNITAKLYAIGRWK